MKAQQAALADEGFIEEMMAAESSRSSMSRTPGRGYSKALRLLAEGEHTAAC